MLPKKKRVTKDIFQTIMKKGNIVSGSFFLFRYIKEAPPAYAFVVAKKVANGAVKRNSLRRNGYNILKTYNLRDSTGIFFYKKEALTVPTIDIKKDIDSILKRAKII